MLASETAKVWATVMVSAMAMESVRAMASLRPIRLSHPNHRSRRFRPSLHPEGAQA